jgi:hypothetical protein
MRGVIMSIRRSKEEWERIVASYSVLPGPKEEFYKEHKIKSAALEYT